MTQWVIPELYCPFTPAVNDRAREAEEETASWLDRHGLASGSLAQAVSAAAARLAARTRPRADYEPLSAVSDFYAWMFIRDDYCDEGAAGLSASGLFEADLGSLAVLEASRHGLDHAGHNEAPQDGADGARERALEDVLGRLAGLAGGRAWRRSLGRQMRAYFQATFWEAGNRARGEVPHLALYTRMRPVAAGVRVDDVLLGVGAPEAHGAVLPAEPGSEPLLATLSGHAERAVCWSNDLYSLDKELATGDVHNLIVVLCRERGLCIADAVSEAAAMHDREVRGFVEEEERLAELMRQSRRDRTTFPPWLPHYIEALEHRIRGNLDWSLAAARYGAPAAANTPGVEPDGGSS